jgi:hypothetical protein
MSHMQQGQEICILFWHQFGPIQLPVQWVLGHSIHEKAAGSEDLPSIHQGHFYLCLYM